VPNNQQQAAEQLALVLTNHGLQRRTARALAPAAAITGLGPIAVSNALRIPHRQRAGAGLPASPPRRSAAGRYPHLRPLRGLHRHRARVNSATHSM
jgi:hypothetical protein